ncbi:MAG TPA: DUF4340 domain-containing protein [Anaerolineales bacterium]|nr:DUF4340 domain-containing protein [Anaerolineales bacterium]
MIRKTTWILLALFGVSILAIVLWSARGEQPGSAEATPAAAPLWTVDSASIRSIRLEDTGSGTLVEVERHPEEAWHLVQPTVGPADAGRVERAASWLASPQPRGVVEAGGDWAAFGLDVPAKRITVTLDDGAQHMVEVGRTDPTGAVMYARIPGGAQVYLMSKFGLDEVLGLLDSVPVAELTATPQSTAPTVSPAATTTP